MCPGKVERDSDSDSNDESDMEDNDNDESHSHTPPGLQTDAQLRKSQAKAKLAQAEKLYTEKGQFNPAMARAEKKRAKKAKKLSLGDDFNFAEAFADEVKLQDSPAASDNDDEAAE